MSHWALQCNNIGTHIASCRSPLQSFCPRGRSEHVSTLATSIFLPGINPTPSTSHANLTSISHSQQSWTSTTVTVSRSVEPTKEEEPKKGGHSNEKTVVKYWWFWLIVVMAVLLIVMVAYIMLLRYKKRSIINSVKNHIIN